MRNAFTTVVAASIAAFATAVCGQTSTYLAIGDSLAFGFERLDLTPTTADQGYVSLVADAIGARTGTRPDVLNFGIPTESTTSFLAGGNIATQLNANYAGLSLQSQSQALDFALAAHASGQISIDHVTVQLGVNDLLQAVDDDFFMLPFALQLATLAGALDQAINNLGGIFGMLASNLPGADVRVVGYYDPFAPLLTMPQLDPTGGDGVAIAAFSADGIRLLNAELRDLAESFGFDFVDPYQAFLGRELELTLITELNLDSPNIHPNAAGYEVLAGEIISVPAPGQLAVLALGGAFATRRRRAG